MHPHIRAVRTAGFGFYCLLFNQHCFVSCLRSVFCASLYILFLVKLVTHGWPSGKPVLTAVEIVNISGHHFDGLSRRAMCRGNCLVRPSMTWTVNVNNLYIYQSYTHKETAQSLQHRVANSVSREACLLCLLVICSSSRVFFLDQRTNHSQQTAKAISWHAKHCLKFNNIFRSQFARTSRKQNPSTGCLQIHTFDLQLCCLRRHCFSSKMRHKANIRKRRFVFTFLRGISVNITLMKIKDYILRT